MCFNVSAASVRGICQFDSTLYIQQRKVQSDTMKSCLILQHRPYLKSCQTLFLKLVTHATNICFVAKHTGFFLTAPGFSFQERVTDLLLVLGVYRLLRPLLHQVK